MIRTGVLLSLVPLGVMIGVSLWGWVMLPEDARIAMHWGISGEPDRFAGRTEALITLPLIGMLTAWLAAIAPRFERRRANLEASRGLYLAGWIGGLSVLAVAHLTIIIGGVRGDAPLWLTLGAVALLIAVIGNFMAKSRSNHLAGLRTPATRASEDAWIAANRFTGWAFVLTGVLGAVALLVAGTVLAAAVIVAGTLSAAAVGAWVGHRAANAG